MKKVFVDTGGFIALADELEEHHRKALELFSDFSKDKVLVTTEFVVDEFFTFVRCRKKEPVDKIVRFIRGVLVSDIKMYGISSDVFSMAFKIMAKYDDQYFSFTDCVSFVAMNELKIKDVLTTDKHFTIAGFNNLL